MSQCHHTDLGIPFCTPDMSQHGHVVTQAYCLRTFHVPYCQMTTQVLLSSHLVLLPGSTNVPICILVVSRQCHMMMQACLCTCRVPLPTYGETGTPVGMSAVAATTMLHRGYTRIARRGSTRLCACCVQHHQQTQAFQPARSKATTWWCRHAHSLLLCPSITTWQLPC